MKPAVLSAYCALTIALGIVVPSVSFGKIYFEENFRNYADTAPGVTADSDITVGNDPIWVNQAELNIRTKEGGPVFAPSIDAPELGAFDLYFGFRFMNATAPKGDHAGVPGCFDVVLTDTKGKSTSIPIRSDGAASADLAFMANRKWEEVALRAEGGKITVHVTRDRRFQPVATVPFAGRLAAVNVNALKDKHFSLRNIVLRDPEPLKTYPVEKHFADFRALTQPIAGAVAQPVTIVPNPTAGVRLRVGSGATMAINWSNGETTEVPMSIAPQSHVLRVSALGKAKQEKVSLPDSIIQLGDRGSFARQYVRPHLKMYVSLYDAEPQAIDLLRDWDSLPKASEHPLDIDFVAQPDGSVNFFLDGSYIRTLREDAASVKSVVFTPGEGSQVAVKKVRTGGFDGNRFTLLDLSSTPRAKAFVTAKPSLKPGLQTVAGIPMDVADGMNSADVGICKQGKGNWALEVEEYHGRSPLDGFPSAIHFRLPAAAYGKAYVLCALDPDTGKDGCLTTRLGYYVHNGSGGNMIGDNQIVVEDGKMPDNFKQVGTVRLNGKGVPLYLAEIDLPLGDILDIPARKEYIDFEFIGKGWVNFEQLDNTMKPDPNSDSAFNIFAVTLEKAPVVMDIQPSQPANVFTIDEPNRITTVTLKAVLPDARGKLVWVARDHTGKEVFKGEKAFGLAKPGDGVNIPISLSTAPIGFFSLTIDLNDATGTRFIRHPARFAILPKDERTLDKYQSPYATWWFSAHGSPGDLDLGGPLMKKAGIRKASWNHLTPEACEKYNITGCGSLMCPGVREFDKGTGTFKAGEEGFVAKIKEGLAKAPEADHMLIWHETAPGYGIPEELLGKPVPPVPDGDKWLAAYINEVGRIMRKHFPHIKIQIGNSSASIGAATRPLRAGADPQFYDVIGIETPSQVIAPEKLQEVGLQGMLISQDIASTLAGRKVRLNGCREFVYRCERDMGEQQQAEWYMRDVLISLSHDFSLISPGIFFDCLNGYYNGLWGGSGILQRAPYCYPKRAYVAYAILTSVLDGVTFSRQIPTGSTTVYAIEFKRADGMFATALWASRGEAMLALNGLSEIDVTTMYGAKSRLAAGASTVEAGTSPTYLVSSKPLVDVAVAMRTFGKDMALARRAQVASALDDVAAMTLAPDPDLASTHTRFLPILQPSDFTLTQVDDDEKGACIEVALDLTKHKDTSKYVTEYTTVRLNEPVPVPGHPDVIGVWVKGDSNWGQIRFEIEDANGEVFKNLSTGRSWGCDIMDWPGNLCINFDGWGYVYQTLFPTTLVNDHSPGPTSEQWVSEGGDKKIDLPIKIRAITVGMNRTKLDLLDFKSSTGVVRLRDVSGIQ